MRSGHKFYANICVVVSPREEYEVCPIDCLVSQLGGTVGIFFGVSIMEVIFLMEWLLAALLSRIQTNKQ